MKIYNKIYRKFINFINLLYFYAKLLHYKLIGQIKIGHNCKIDPYAYLEINNNNLNPYQIEIGNNTKIKDYVRICSRSGFIKIGANCSLNPYSVILGYGGVTIGNNVLIASNTTITAFQHNYIAKEILIKKQGNRFKGINIEDDVWIGAGVRILDGVNIKKGSIVGAGSVVTKDTEPYSVNIGVPARLIRKRI